MGKSPTLRQMDKQFSILNDRINGATSSPPFEFRKVLFIYPLLVLFVLLSVKPKFIMKVDYTTHHSHDELCTRKLLTWFTVFQLPLIYFML
jgi:hypothetical protein